VSAQENKGLVSKAIEEVWNQGNLEAVNRYFAEHYVDHTPLPGQDPGPEGYKQAVALIRAAFPDLHLTLDDVIAEEDKVSFRYTMSGTHQGEFMGMTPTGRAFSVAGMIFARAAEGKFTDRWAILDTISLMQQLDVSAQADTHPSAEEAG